MNKLIVANWKMNKTVEEAIFSAKDIKKSLKNGKDAEVVICPPFTTLQSVSREFKNTNIKLGAQNMYFEEAGAYTGEVSALMLRDIGCEYVILGHSERREIFFEDDFLVNRKVIAALNHSLMPILCVGENLEQRKLNKTNEVIEHQLKNCLKDVGENQVSKVVIAYEPIWAISKGNPNHKPATADDAGKIHNFIRNILVEMYGANTSENIRIIYGGSVKPENAKELLSMSNIDGCLVGNASLNAKSFVEIVKAVNLFV